MSQSRRHLRWLLFGQQNGLCFYCQEPMSLSYARRDNIWGNSLTVEHLTRRADGGGGHLVAACRTCNSRRGDRDPAAYRALRSDRRMT